jgi:hypothetical protein
MHEYPSNWLSVKAKTNGLAGVWHRLNVTFDGSSSATGVAIYLDGQALPKVTVDADTLSKSIETSAPLQIGARHTSLPFVGKLDDLRVYDSLFPPEQVEKYQLHLLARIPASQRTVTAYFNQNGVEFRPPEIPPDEWEWIRRRHGR